MSSYKVFYFNGRGSGELLRQIFVVAGKEFEDIRYSMEEWPLHKDEMPFGKIPVVEIDGVKLPQSFAIARFLSRKFGFAGKDNFEQAQVDAVADQFKDYLHDIQPVISVMFGVKQGDMEQLKKDILYPTRDNKLGYLCDMIKNNNSGYLVGDSLTYADLALAEHAAFFAEKFPGYWDKMTEIADHATKVRSNPNLKKWIDSRPDTFF